MENKVLTDFVACQKSRYGTMFFMEESILSSGRRKIILMTEKLAGELRLAIRDDQIDISSLENDEKVGNYYRILKTTNLHNRPGSQEKARLVKDLAGDMIKDHEGILINELMPGELLRGVSSKTNPGWLAVVIEHDFSSLAPKAIGWVELSSNLEKLATKKVTRPVKLKSLELAVNDLLGVRYFVGGKSKITGYDCSSFTHKVIYDTKGLWLPRRAAWQALVGSEVSPENIQPGDLAFYEEGPDWKVEHVGLVYKTQGQKSPIIAHVSRYEGEVKVNDLTLTPWFRANFRLKNYGRI